MLVKIIKSSDCHPLTNREIVLPDCSVVNQNIPVFTAWKLYLLQRKKAKHAKSKFGIMEILLNFVMAQSRVVFFFNFPTLPRKAQETGGNDAGEQGGDPMDVTEDDPDDDEDEGGPAASKRSKPRKSRASLYAAATSAAAAATAPSTTAAAAPSTAAAAAASSAAAPSAAAAALVEPPQGPRRTTRKSVPVQREDFVRFSDFDDDDDGNSSTHGHGFDGPLDYDDEGESIYGSDDDNDSDEDENEDEDGSDEDFQLHRAKSHTRSAKAAGTSNSSATQKRRMEEFQSISKNDTKIQQFVASYLPKEDVCKDDVEKADALFRLTGPTYPPPVNIGNVPRRTKAYLQVSYCGWVIVRRFI